MTSTDLSRLEIRTGNSANWLYLRAIAHWRHVRARVWCLVPLDSDPNYGDGPLFDPDRADAVEGRNDAQGTCRLDCGCVNEVTFLHTRPEGDHYRLMLLLPRGDVSTSIETCPAHWSPESRLWHRGLSGPVFLEATLRAAEMDAIRGAIRARRSGIGPMSLAGLCGAAGVIEDPAQLKPGTETLDSLKVMAGLRGHRVMEQTDLTWFRVR